ncbi:hypothetical protein GCM10022214_83480 [Actinomadura miaoliensis]|uniref:Uncharacterized protein n=1 Tax=Actinomadura miaoliensis TaxID=430685 RepID=A0ABP7X4Z7_9ACTN
MAPDDCDPRHNVRPPLDGPDPCEPAPDGCVPACGLDGPGVWEFARPPAVPPLPALPGDGAPPADPALTPPEPLPAVGVVTGGPEGGAASGPEAGDPADEGTGPVVGPVAGGTVPPAGGAMPHSSQKPSSPTVPEQSGWVHRVIAPPPPRSPTL